MRALIDTIFSPVLLWLTKIFDSIMQMSVPVAQPLNVNKYFGVFGLFGSGWITFVTTVCALASVYMVCYIVVTQQGLFIKIKDMLKWW